MKIDDHYDIIILVSNDLTDDRRMHRTCQTLSDAGATVLLIGRKLPGSMPLEDRVYDQLRISCRCHQGPAFYMELIWRMAMRLRSMTYDKLVCVDFDTLAVLKLVDTSDSVVYFDSHELFTEVPELANQPIKKWIWKRLAMSVRSKINCCYTVSSHIAEVLQQDYGLNAAVIHNVPLRRSKEVAQSADPYEGGPLTLVYLGVLNPGRGIEEAIKITLESPMLRLNIIGDGPDRQRLRQLAGGDDRIIWHGRLGDGDFQQVLQSSHIGLNLLDLTSQSYYLSLANKFFDYAHAGLPIITMDAPTYQRLIKEYDCGYLVTALSTLELGDLVSAVIADPASICDKRIGALKMASDYNWQIESRRLLKLYDML